MSALDRFLRYISYHTTSDPDSDSCPSTARQLVLARQLKAELEEIGAQNVRSDEKGYTYAVIDASEDCEKLPCIGLIAHIDTSSAISGENVKPRMIDNYDGGDITLCEGVVMTVSDFPSLSDYKGESLIVTDGTTLLGADDKAGVAEIMDACERIINENIPHGKIVVAFTPDEEVGRGTESFDLDNFGAELAYTVDGGKLGELEYECFNAVAAAVKINGFSIHPGDAKNKMINAARIACEFVSLMPEAETPEHTEGYEGFFHLCGMSGSEESAVLDYIIRDFDIAIVERRKKFMLAAAEMLNVKYGEGTVEVTLSDSYRNMKEKIEPHMEIVERAKAAFAENGIEAVTTPIRGGTDGAQLSYKGLPCPNLSTGGHNFHGKYEYIPVHALGKMSDVIISLVKAR